MTCEHAFVQHAASFNQDCIAGYSHSFLNLAQIMIRDSKKKTKFRTETSKMSPGTSSAASIYTSDIINLNKMTNARKYDKPQLLQNL